MPDIKEESNSISKLQSPFKWLREVDAEDKEWWNLRKMVF